MPVASSEATVNLIHGIPGLSATVCVNGNVALPTFDYKDIATATLQEGSVDIAIVPAPTSAPTIGESCPATVPGLDLTGVQFDAGSNYSVVAHLGFGGGNVATVFENDVSSARPGTSRIVLHHVADADSLVARIGRPTPSALDVTTEEFSNGDEVPLVVQPRVRPGNWDVRLFDVATEVPVLGPERLQFRPRTAYLLYVVGAGSELSLLSLPIALPPF